MSTLSPAEQLRATLTAAKLDGKPDFDELWDLMLYGSPKDERRISYPYSTRDRHQWIDALESSKEAYRTAYEGGRGPSSEYVGALYGLLERREPAVLNDRRARDQMAESA